MNDFGMVVGRADTVNAGQQHAFLYDGSTMLDLGTIGCNYPNSQASAINNSGVVAGHAALYDLDSVIGVRAFVWDSKNGMRDLTNLLDSTGSGWVVMRAKAINDDGVIVGEGADSNGNIRAVMLTPTTAT